MFGTALEVSYLLGGQVHVIWGFGRLVRTSETEVGVSWVYPKRTRRPYRIEGTCSTVLLR